MAGKTKPTITVMWVRSSRTRPPNGDIKLGQNSSSLFLRTINCSKCPLGPIKIGSYSPASLLCQRPLLGCPEDSSNSVQSDSVWVKRKSSSPSPLYHSLDLFWISNASNIHPVTWCKYLKATLDNLFSPIQSNHGCGQVVQFKDLDVEVRQRIDSTTTWEAESTRRCEKKLTSSRRVHCLSCF